MKASRIIIAATILGTLAGASAEAYAKKVSYFSLVMGVNRAMGAGSATLRYADDDAILFHRLLTSVGSSRLLTRPDAATERVHGASMGRYRLATLANLRKEAASLFEEAKRAAARGDEVHFVFFYSGHGDVENNEGYLALDDGRLTAQQLETVLLAASPAAVNHLIVDACRSYFLVSDKRAGGVHEKAKGPFYHRDGLAKRYPNTGFLLSTASAASSHEWGALQAGIFSHEVRSGLLGGADANHDGRVSYDEIAAFILVANDKVANERYRPQLYVRAPRADGRQSLLDLARFRGAKIALPAKGGRFMVEDARGVRLADLHTSPSLPVTLRLPFSNGKIFVHDLVREREYVFRSRRAPLRLAALTPRPTRHREKGAAHEAFSQIFAKAFSSSAFKLKLTCVHEGGGRPDCERIYAECLAAGAKPSPTSMTTKASSTSQTMTNEDDWRAPIVAIYGGIYLMRRDFDIKDALAHETMPRYRSSLLRSVKIGAVLHPLRPFLDGAWSQIGIVFDFVHSEAFSTYTSDTSAPTSISQLDIGLRYDWNLYRSLRSLRLRAAIAYSRTAFSIDAPPTLELLPDVSYDAITFVVGAHMPLFVRGRLSIGVDGGFGFLTMLSSGEIEESSDLTYGPATTSGVDIEGGVVASYWMFDFAFRGHYRYIFSSFDQSCERDASCLVAAGFVDKYYGFSATLGVHY